MVREQNKPESGVENRDVMITVKSMDLVGPTKTQRPEHIRICFRRIFAGIPLTESGFQPVASILLSFSKLVFLPPQIFADR